MAKKSVKVEVNNFVQGLITEANPLNFPPNASVDETNFVLNRDGTRQRRLGMDFENGYSLIASEITTQRLNESTPIPFKWTNVAGNADDNFLVIQSGTSVMIFDLGVDSISGNGVIGTVDLSGFGFSSATPFSYSSIDGKLVVVAGVNDIAVISYSDNAFTALAKSLLVRDVWGVQVTEDDRYESDPQFRGTEGYRTHVYNLYNQSWGIPRMSNLGNVAGGGILDPIVIYSQLGKYPSNSEAVWLGMQFQPVAAEQPPSERLYPELFEQSFGSEISSARGHYVIDLLRRGLSRDENIARAAQKYPQLSMQEYGGKRDITPGGATTVCEFAGRVFYAGFSGDVIDGDRRSPSLSNFILFSQLVKNSDDINKCYQEGDPTSRESNDLVDTDGGFIRLSGAEGIVKMVNLGGVLVVLAKNGVWIVSGGSDYGFNATNYKAERISTFGVIGKDTVVEDGSRALFWSEDGIYAVVKDQFGSYNVENITQKTIQKMYDAIPAIAKERATGIFDPIGKRLRWLYQINDRFTPESQTQELILDLTLGAFYTFTIAHTLGSSPELLAPFAAIPFVIRTTGAEVRSGTDLVVSDGDFVTIPYTQRDSAVQATRYLCAKVDNGQVFITFGYYNNASFVDWFSHNGEGADAYAYMVTGAVTAGDSSVAKQLPYLTLHFRRTEVGVTGSLVPMNQSSCLVQSQWDWANSANANKWSSQFQGYRYRKAYLAADQDDPYDSGFELVTTKNKIRGRGRAFALRMETEPLKDCNIIGWSIALNGNPVT